MPASPPPTPEPAPASASGEALPVARLVIACPDRPGIVAAVSGLLAAEGANITQSDQYSTDPEGGTFLMRVEFHIAAEARERLQAAFGDVAERFQMHWRMWHSGQRKRVALLVSRHEHCLLDLLWRWRRGELDCDIGLVVSNHPDLRDEVSMFGVEFRHIPVTRDNKPQAEEELLQALGDGYDLVVLARYMQILSGSLLQRLDAPVINIHHSFLPAFAGADPYTRALQRGVKVIGATAHYVTEDLDEGPIIEQDTAHVSHRETAESLTRIGRDIERTVLARAVNWHLEDRVLISGTGTVVFA